MSGRDELLLFRREAGSQRHVRVGAMGRGADVTAARTVGEGIHFHGGYSWYTPIAGARERGFVAQPIYYGMLLFQLAGSGRLIESTLDYEQDAPLLTLHGRAKAASRPSVQ